MDSAHLEIVCFLVVSVILVPILVLGKGAVFPVLDQLDETILNYVFPARYPGVLVYEQMMCGVPATSLKPFAPGFVLLFKIMPPLYAFIAMYAIVILVAGLGTYMCVKRLTGSSIIALLSGAVFALLPFRSIYGISLSGTPWLVACIIFLNDGINSMESHKDSKAVKDNTGNFRVWSILLPAVGIAFYAAASSLVLVGYAAIIMTGLYLTADWVISKKPNKALLCSLILIGIIYAALNIDLVSQLFFGGEFVSHREEYVINGFNFFNSFKGIMLEGMDHYESLHIYIYIPIVAAALFLSVKHIMLNKGSKEENTEPIGKIYVIAALTMILLGFFYAVFACEQMANLKNNMSGMIKTFQFQRFYWLLAGGWYIILGISLGVIWKIMKKKLPICGLIIVAILYLPTLIYVAKNPLCILRQNINQMNNGSAVTGYITWEALYADKQMETIEKDIESATGEEQSEYRIAHIAMSPIPSLMNGFYTVDGYSNDYPLEYKHEFGKIIEKELEKSDQLSDYYYEWGNRCYLFCADLGGAYLIPGNNDIKISGTEFDYDILREMNCKYIFSGGEITDAEAGGLTLFNVYCDDSSYWKIWVYSL
ncbi:MAG: DUF6044 family protein [Lachnospiraceae bacterium]|nr:DUF6044 family protein [Lachnospiraceae bacterium]